MGAAAANGAACRVNWSRMRELCEPMDFILMEVPRHGINQWPSCVDFRPLLMPVSLLLIGLSQPQNICFGPRRSADLQADWQPRPGESARNRNRWQSKNVERPCIAQRKNLFCA